VHAIDRAEGSARPGMVGTVLDVDPVGPHPDDLPLATVRFDAGFTLSGIPANELHEMPTG